MRWKRLVNNRGLEGKGLLSFLYFMAIPPQPGLSTLFPSYFYHRVSLFPGVGSEPRISIAFNLIPIDWVSNCSSEV
jgi:hypothetical protein